MDNLPPSDDHNSNGNDHSPPFGSNFDPHSNPVDPNNPYASPPQPPPQNSPPPQTTPPEPTNIPEIPDDPSKHSHYSQVAQHKPRDAHGHFIPYEHPTNTPNPSTPSNPALNGAGLPPIIEINQNSAPTYKKDPPAFGFFITNPVTYLKAFLNRLIKRQTVTIKIPILLILAFMVGIGGFGIGFQSGTTWALAKLFPNYSPLLHREITEQGTIQKSSKGYYLKANDKNKTIWTLQSTSANVKLVDYVNQQVQVKGNLTSTPNLIDVSEVISFDDNKPTPVISAPTPQPATNSGQITP